MSDSLWLTVLGMSVATFLIRASFLVFGQSLRFPTSVVQALGLLDAPEGGGEVLTDADGRWRGRQGRRR